MIIDLSLNPVYFYSNLIPKIYFFRRGEIIAG